MLSMCKDTKIEIIATILLSVTQQRQLWNDAAINRSPLAQAIHQKRQAFGEWPELARPDTRLFFFVPSDDDHLFFVSAGGESR